MSHNVGTHCLPDWRGGWVGEWEDPSQTAVYMDIDYENILAKGD